MTDGIAASQLHSLVQRIERLEEEKAAAAEDIREVYAEARARGFHVGALREVIRLRKQDADERAARMAAVDMYLRALGQLADTPLGEAAMERAERQERETAAKLARAEKGRRRTGKLDKAVAGLGTPVPVTDEERDKGVVAAFDRDGTRMSIAVPGAGDA